MADYPEQDVKRFFEATLAAATEAAKAPMGGRFSSIKEAAAPAYVALKQKGNWPYGPRTIGGFIGQLSAEQKAALDGVLEAEPLPSPRTARPVSLTEKFAKDSDLRIRFLNDVNAGASRAKLAFTYGLPLELVNMAFTQSVLRESGADYGKTGTLLCGTSPYLQYLRARLKIVKDNPRWSALANNVEIDQKNMTFHPRGKWPFTPTKEEIDQLRTLENDKRQAEERLKPPGEIPIPSVLSGDTLPEDMVPDRHGGSPHSKKWAEKQGLRTTKTQR